MVKLYSYLLLFILMPLCALILSGCAKKTNNMPLAVIRYDDSLASAQQSVAQDDVQASVDTPTIQEIPVDQVAEYEAQYSDIPVPLTAQAKKYHIISYADKQQLHIHYMVLLDKTYLMQFYSQEMERLGWQQGAVFAVPDTVFIFSTPLKTCVIRIEENKRGVVITIFYEKKICPSGY